MKNTLNPVIIKGLYWFFRIGFYLHALITLALILLNHITYWDGWKYTIRGKFGVREEHWRPMKVNVIDETADPIFMMHKAGWVRFDYENLAEGLTLKNISITLLDISVLLVTLAITYQIMKIFSSLVNNQVFDMKNIRRLRWIGLLIIAVPILKYAFNQLFFSVVQAKISISGHKIGAYGFGSSFYYMILLAIMIFTLTEIFKYGLSLQKENDLTV